LAAAATTGSWALSYERSRSAEAGAPFLNSGVTGRIIGNPETGHKRASSLRSRLFNTGNAERLTPPRMAGCQCILLTRQEEKPLLQHEGAKAKLRFLCTPAIIFLVRLTMTGSVQSHSSKGRYESL